MTRPTDWDVLDLDGDPTPGDPFSLRELARRFREFAADVEHANGQLAAVAANYVAISWQGRSGAAFRDESDELPGQLRKLANSYRMAGDALGAYTPDLDAAQARADSALARGRDARARRDRAQALVGPARIALITAEAALSELIPASRHPVEVPPPDPARVAQAIRDHDVVRANLERARSTVDAAQEDLDAARRLALTASQMRAEAAAICVRSIRSASRAGLKNKAWRPWGGLLEHAGRFWHAAVQAAKVAVAVLGVVVLVVGGPVAWAVFAAALVVLADTLVQYAGGRASLWDVLFALADCVPAPVGLAATAGAARAVRAARRSLREGRTFLPISLGAGRALLATMAESLRDLCAQTVIVIKKKLPRGGAVRAHDELRRVVLRARLRSGGGAAERDE
ncbi:MULTISPECIES: WXG100 family type VII secretion target [unclassified Frankia]|uniref:WXG100 family type VII secretion target n=1 Tax=unclassified Frankia TaxID=2632575 RepID=UPI001EF3F2DD|nr:MULTISPECIES: WXG100 family type VII secretion target [unclassified Frankia]